MNKWIGAGNLSTDVERIEANNLTMCRFQVAVNENYTKDGERPVQFITIIAWRKLAENALKYLKKGNKVGIIGKLQNRQYEAKDGSKKYVTEIVAEEIEFFNTKPKASDVKIEDNVEEDDIFGDLP